MSKFKKIIAVIVCIVCIFLMFCISASATSPYCTFPWTQPKADEINGYMEIFCEYNGEPCVMVYSFQSLYPYSGTPKNYINGYVSVNSTGITVYFFNNGDFSLRLVWSYYRSNPSSMFGQSYETGITPGESSSSLVYSPWIPNGWVIKRVRCYGILSPNTDSLNYFAGSSAYGPIIYGNDTIVDTKLDTIISILQGQNNNDVVGAIQQSGQNIQNNQNENTDKIIENQQQIQENEKNEAESSGQGSVDDVSGAIDDKSAGFISAISNLVGSMSYNGTACAWSFPAIKLPAIEGVMPEYQLTEEQPIDFEFWVNKIPANILLLVRSVLTIALIGYCFKELYGTISYVLTLKGGGNSE